eukprot:scaffold102563_cov47-Prasinocladus_malaysianus.AAC.1
MAKIGRCARDYATMPSTTNTCIYSAIASVPTRRHTLLGQQCHRQGVFRERIRFSGLKETLIQRDARTLALDSSTEYNREMKQAMGWEHVSPFEYHFDRGLYFHEVEPNVYCGSQPRNTSDVEYLANEINVTTILNLQQDRDLEYWGVDIHSLSRRSNELGLKLVRTP